MNLISRVAFLAALMNTIHGYGQEGVSYKTVQVDGLNIFYRESGPTSGPVMLLLHGVPTSSRMYQPMLASTLSARYRLIAPDFPGFGHSSWPSPKEFSYTFNHLAHVTEGFADALKLSRYTLYLHDYGGPVGMRMAVHHPEKVEAIIIQNAVSHEEGLSSLWATRRAFWNDRTAHEAAFRKGFLSLETTRNRHLGTSPHPERIDPDTWTDEFYFLNPPGQADILSSIKERYRFPLSGMEQQGGWVRWVRRRWWHTGGGEPQASDGRIKVAGVRA